LILQKIYPAMASYSKKIYPAMATNYSIATNVSNV
jgi:hypothetical protein